MGLPRRGRQRGFRIRVLAQRVVAPRPPVGGTRAGTYRGVSHRSLRRSPRRRLGRLQRRSSGPGFGDRPRGGVSRRPRRVVIVVGPARSPSRAGGIQAAPVRLTGRCPRQSPAQVRRSYAKEGHGRTSRLRLHSAPFSRGRRSSCMTCAQCRPRTPHRMLRRVTAPTTAGGSTVALPALR